MRKLRCIWTTIMAIRMIAIRVIAISLISVTLMACATVGVKRSHIAVYGADDVGIHSISTPSAETSASFDVPPGFTLVGANSTSYRFPLSYPKGMLGDGVPPEVSNVRVVTWKADGLELVWTTDKDARSVVRCGIASDDLGIEYPEPLYRQDHHITMSNLGGEPAYYCRACSTDLDGNRSIGYGFRIWMQEKLLAAWDVAPCR
jgi:hypothetical protein